MPRAKLRTRELRDHVLAVAVSVLEQEGVVGFTARNIAKQAATSTPALYELFGDRAGLLRAVYYEGFRVLGARLARPAATADPRVDLQALLKVYRTFHAENRMLAELMFSRPFADFRPGLAEADAGEPVRALLVTQVRRCVAAGELDGNATDIALVLDSLVHGLAEAEYAGHLGKSAAVINRRWRLGIAATLAGLAPAGATF
jgi:AcrR family transcriptional regulator